jgi:class 3 adenylate cyclase
MEVRPTVVTVLFACGRLRQEDVRRIMDGCFSILMDEIHEYESTFNQFTGDRLRALFGRIIKTFSIQLLTRSADGE